METIRANRQFAGKPCVACKSDILLGEEIVVCPQCSEAQHEACWTKRGGCASEACATVEAVPAPVAQAEAAPSAPKRNCPACGEEILATARMCPFCSEPLADDATAPRAFAAKRRGFFGGSHWNFAIVGSELVGTCPGKPEVRIPHDRGPLDVSFKKRLLMITVGEKVVKFQFADDIGPVVVDYWLTGNLRPIASHSAGEALSYSILGIFIFQIFISPYALYKASVAGRQIDQYPGLLTGKGKVWAARIISGTILCLIILAFIIMVASQ